MVGILGGYHGGYTSQGVYTSGCIPLRVCIPGCVYLRVCTTVGIPQGVYQKAEKPATESRVAQECLSSGLGIKSGLKEKQRTKTSQPPGYTGVILTFSHFLPFYTFLRGRNNPPNHPLPSGQNCTSGTPTRACTTREVRSVACTGCVRGGVYLREWLGRHIYPGIPHLGYTGRAYTPHSPSFIGSWEA